MKKTLWTSVILLLALASAGCAFDGRVKSSSGSTPEALGDGWEVASPESVGLSSAVLDGISATFRREDTYRTSLSLLVVKRGKLVWEEYFRDKADRDRYQATQSVTKSLTSILLGIALGDSSSFSIDKTLGEIFPDLPAAQAESARRVTLRQLLTMESGIAFYNEEGEFSNQMWVDKPADPLRFMLEKPFFAEPGTRFLYRDVDPQIVGYALQRSTGVSEREYARSRLFAPLGISNFFWESGPDGASMAAHGLHLTPRDLAKIGRLMLDGGSWEGRQLVPADWVLASTSRQVDTDLPFGAGLMPYGYYWWIFPGLGYAAHGSGGQFILVLPGRDMVIVHTGFPHSDLTVDDKEEFLAIMKPLL